jgi:hypothetical protein
MILRMPLFHTRRKFEAALEEAAAEVAHEGRVVLRNIGWLSAGITAVAIGVVIGREIRQRYKFNRRTPYDDYAHSGDEMQDVEFGVGI